MNFELAKDIISSYEKITIIEGQNSNQTILFKIFDKKFAMLLPEKYDNSRAQVFIIDEPDFSYPHIMLNNVNYCGDDVLPCGIYRSVCLWEEASIVQSIQTFEEKISDAIERLLELLLLPCKKIEFEFQKEFMYYWNSSAIEKQKIFLYLDSSSINSQIEVYHNSGTNEYRYVSKAYFLNDLNKIEKGKRVWNNRADIYAFYLKIIDSRGILPPRRGHDWEISDIENIIAGNQIRHINREAFLKLKEDCFSYNIIDLIFEMDINSIPVTFVSRIQCTSGKNNIIYKILNNSNSVIPLKSTRMDNEYLNIIIGNNNKNCKKNVLVAGAGSLGSYIACELAKNGFSKFTIYDEDILQSENYMRWYYGGLLTGKKVNALKFLLENTHPEIAVEAVDKNISVNDIVNIMNKFDYIFFTVGNSDTQLQFNKILKKYGCTAKVFFIWLEAGGKYSHILRINYQSQGCYECLFTNEYGQKVNNKATIEENDNFFDSRVIHNGCGGTRAAYGSAVLLRTTATLLDLLHKEDINNYMDNYLVDIFPEKTSTMQIDFVEKECDCCGHGSE